MKDLGQWILLTFAIFVVVEIITYSEPKNIKGGLILSGLLALGIVLAF